MQNEFLSYLKQLLPVYENQLLKEYTSLKIGGPAKYLVEVSNTEEIQSVIQLADDYEIPYYIIGNGSNTLFLDEGVEGLIIALKDQFSTIKLGSNHTIIAEAGALLKDVCLFALEHGLGGMEFAYGIPASVGGAIYMNAGAFEGEMKDIVESVTFLNEKNQMITMQNEDLEFRYRHSYFMDHHVCITHVVFTLQPRPIDEIKKDMDYYLDRRISKQPLEYPSAGSTFKRPTGSYASLLIDQSGLKGLSVGGAMVSTKHTGFIINYNEATSDDMMELIKQVQTAVFEKTGFELECEMRMIGKQLKTKKK